MLQRDGAGPWSLRRKVMTPTGAASLASNDVAFEDVTAVHKIHVAPCYLGNLRAGVEAHLDALLMKYSFKLAGVPLCYSHVELVDETVLSSSTSSSLSGSMVNLVIPSAAVIYDNPCVHLQVKILWSLFTPRPGVRLSGVVNGVSREHVGCLVFGYFSALISASHLEATYGWSEGRQEWSHRRTGETLVPEQAISFEVLEVLNEGSMLTILGSIDKLLDADSAKPPSSESPRGGKRKRKHLGVHS